MIQRIYNILGMYDCVDGKYLYNRCHLIGYQLTGENANKRNLITGTRSLNVDGMLPFENMVADLMYKKELLLIIVMAAVVYPTRKHLIRHRQSIEM